MMILAGYVYVRTPTDIHELVRDARDFGIRSSTEEGCLSVSFTLDDESTGRLAAFERWQDVEAVERHHSRPYVKAFFQKWGPRIRNEIRHYEAVELARPGPKDPSA